MSAPVEILDTLSEPLLPSRQGDVDHQKLVSSEAGGGDGVEINGTAISAVAEPLLVVPDDGVEQLQDDQQPDDSNQTELRGHREGHVQRKVFRDWPWALLFLNQLLVVIILAVLGMIHVIRDGAPIWSGPDDRSYGDGRNSQPHQHDDRILKENDINDGGGKSSSSSSSNLMKGLSFFVVLIVCVITLSSTLMNLLLGPLSSMMIQITLVVSPLCFGFTVVIALLTFNIPLLIFASVMTILGIIYAISVWHRIPFASANINIAMAALRDNYGLWILGYAMTIKAYLWTAFWSLAVLEIFAYHPLWVYECSTMPSGGFGGDDEIPIICHWSIRGKIIVIASFLSLYWTAQVLKNVFHATIAGVVGTWWFDPNDARSSSALDASSSELVRSATALEHGEVINNRDADGLVSTSETGLGVGGRPPTRSCCSFCGCNPAIYDSWIRSTFYSFGSICFGSLLVGILRLLQTIIKCGRQERRQRRNLDGMSASGPRSGDLFCCLLECLVDHLERLMEFFNKWSFVYVGLYGYSYIDAGKQVAALFAARGWSVIINDHLVSRSLAMMTVLIGLLTGTLGIVVGFLFFGPLGALQTFFLGAILGITSSNIQFGVVVSAIDTIVVAFAESPDSLRFNHPTELYDELIQAWRNAYPQQFDL